MALLGLNHVWQELSDSVPVTDEVDLEDFVEVGICGLSDEVSSADTSIVAQD